VIKEELKETKP